MAFTIKKLFTNAARGSQARGAVEQANAAAVYALSRALTAAGCATATVTSKAKTVNTLTYTIAGVFYSKGATDNLWVLGAAGAATTVAVASFQKYLLLIDTAGAATVLEGTQSVVNAASVTWGNVSGLSAWAPILAALGSTKAVAGVLTIATDATHTFIPGTTLFGATGITATFVDGLDQSILPLIGNEQGTLVGNGA